MSKWSVSIKVNDDMVHYFQTKKVLRQGDLFSTLLFILVADMFTILIPRDKEDGPVPHLVDGGVLFTIHR